MIPMRDGTRLSAYLYFPAGNGPWPVLYEQRYADLKGAATRMANARLARAGYVVCAENFRGAGLSEGRWVGYRALGWGGQQDGYDTVEWLAVQPWSTGRIGTLGSSQAGFAQNFLAVTRPPHLVAQYMIDTGLSLFHEGYRIGGATRIPHLLLHNKGFEDQNLTQFRISYAGASQPLVGETDPAATQARLLGNLGTRPGDALAKAQIGRAHV